MIRTHLKAWGQWREAPTEPPPAPVAQIDALFESGQLSPTMQKVLRLYYLEGRRIDGQRIAGRTQGRKRVFMKDKYQGRSPTEFYIAKRIAEEAVAHMLRDILADEMAGPETVSQCTTT